MIDSFIDTSIQHKHILHKYSFNKIYDNMMKLVEENYITCNKNYLDDSKLEIFCYNKKCVYDKHWNDFSMSARGLVLCPERKKIIGLPFSKFFNYGEFKHEELEDNSFEPEFEISNKVDGSLGIIFYYNNKWQVSTKRTFYSDQALEAQKILEKKWTLSNEKYGYHKFVDKSYTYLVEIVYPENKNVIDYQKVRDLFYLSSYNNLTFVEMYGPTNGLGVVQKIQYGKYNLKNFAKFSRKIPGSQEGFVIKFKDYKDGLRLKFKGDEYLRLTKIRSGITPLGVWNILRKMDNLDNIRIDLDEELLASFNELVGVFNKKFSDQIEYIDSVHVKYKEVSDRDVGMKIKYGDINKLDGKIIFLCRKDNLMTECYKEGKLRDFVFEMFRPDGNFLGEI
jgi:RNA ligase